MKAAEAVARRLAEHGVSVIYEMVGGMITHLLDAAAGVPSLRIVSMHHEQGAAFAADGFARIAGRPAVAMATSGPGATNLLTGIGSCHFDSVPALFITGQVNRAEMRGERGVRQLGFQETDIVAMARPITKAAWLASDPATLLELIDRGWELATSGRPGPVLIDIPMDVQRADIAYVPLPRAAKAEAAPAPAAVATAWNVLRAAERPLILAGGGLRAAGCLPTFRELAALAGVPVVNSLMAVDALPHADPLRVGLIGSYGNRWANQALGEADALLVLGSRLDIRQTGADTVSFTARKHIVHVDCDPAEQNNRIAGCTALTTGLRGFIAASADLLRHDRLAHPGWSARIASLRVAHPDDAELSDDSGIHPNRLMHRISAVSAAAVGYVVDVGQHQMWAAQSLRLGAGQFFITSGGMGAMGYALPAAIGAAHAAAGSVVMIAGDGGMQLNIQELQTVRRGGLPLKLIVLNNRCHGMVRQFQQSYFGSRYQSTVDGYSAPDFAAVATAYGIPARQVATEAGLEPALAWLWQQPSAPALLEVALDSSLNVYPKLAFGRPFPAMEPDARPLDMEGT